MQLLEPLYGLAESVSYWGSVLVNGLKRILKCTLYICCSLVFKVFEKARMAYELIVLVKHSTLESIILKNSKHIEDVFKKPKEYELYSFQEFRLKRIDILDKEKCFQFKVK